jgi:hypothetical protein
MDYLQEAKQKIEQSQGDIRWEGQKERLTELATVYAAIAQAEALQSIAKHLKRIADMTLPEYPDFDDSGDIAEARSLNLQ